MISLGYSSVYSSPIHCLRDIRPSLIHVVIAETTYLEVIHLVVPHYIILYQLKLLLYFYIQLSYMLLISKVKVYNDNVLNLPYITIFDSYRV